MGTVARTMHAPLPPGSRAFVFKKTPGENGPPTFYIGEGDYLSMKFDWSGLTAMGQVSIDKNFDTLGENATPMELVPEPKDIELKVCVTQYVPVPTPAPTADTSKTATKSGKTRPPI